MAVRAYRVDVSGTATVVSAATPSPRTIIVAGATLQSVDFGGAGITHGAGMQGDHINGLAIRLDPDAVVYGITAGGTVTVQVFEQRT
jgi:hypothetical protein